MSFVNWYFTKKFCCACSQHYWWNSLYIPRELSLSRGITTWLTRVHYRVMIVWMIQQLGGSDHCSGNFYQSLQHGLVIYTYSCSAVLQDQIIILHSYCSRQLGGFSSSKAVKSTEILHCPLPTLLKPFKTLTTGGSVFSEVRV